MALGPSDAVKQLTSYLGSIERDLGEAADQELREGVKRQAVKLAGQFWQRRLEAMPEIPLAHVKAMSLDLDFLSADLPPNLTAELDELRQTLNLILTPGAEQEFFTSQRSTKYHAIQVERLVPILRKLRGDPTRLQPLAELADLLSAE